MLIKSILKHKKAIGIILTFTLLFTINAPFLSNDAQALGDGTWINPYNVSQAISSQNNGVKTVIGYVVGQPISSTSIRTSSFTDNYALAIADSKSETNASKTIYVQITTSCRSSFGLFSNPGLIGSCVKVTGDLNTYYSPHAGIKNISRIEKVQTSISPTPYPTSSTPKSTSSPSASANYNEYYKNVFGKTGAEFKKALHDIIDNHTQITYDEVWNAIKETDEDPNNSSNVILIYSGRSQSKNSYGSGLDNWNREHVWAKSHGDFGTVKGPGTDLHHLRPEDVSVNSARGNKEFDNGGSYHTEATQCKTDSDSWEPRDAVKGDVARMLFYMAVRYEGDNGEIDLELNNSVNNGYAPYHGKLSTLLQWHAQDPVDAFEIRRNNIIYSKWQHNRNPFIDHPEWVQSIWN